MDKKQIGERLETLYYLEIENQIDYFDEILLWSNEYKSLFGEDEYIRNFEEEYHKQRRYNSEDRNI